MQTLFKGRTVYVAEPEETSDNGLAAGVSRYSFRWRAGCFGKRSNPDCLFKTGMSNIDQRGEPY